MNIDIIQKLKKIFGLSKITPPKQTFMPLEAPYMEGMMGWYNRTMQMSRERQSIYYDMEQISEFVLGASALEMYTEDAFPFNQERGSTIWVSSQNSKIIQIIENLNRKIDIETLIPSMAYTTAQYGDSFNYLSISKDGVVSVRQISPTMLTRIEDQYGRLLGFTPGIVDYVPGKDTTIPTPLSRPWDVLHTRLCSAYTRVTGHGTSMLMPVRYIWRQLKIMMDSIVLYRWTRGPDRLVYYVDVGTNPPEQQMQILNRWKLYVKKKQHFNPSTGSFDQEWNPECYTGDTKVALLDGRNLSMVELCQEYKEGECFWVYSLDPKSHRIVPGLAQHPHLIRKKAPILKITLDNGQCVKCTPENGIMRRDGTMVPARELKPGDSLMPFYRKEQNMSGNGQQYEKVYNPGTNSWKYTHRLVVGPIPKKKVIHHKDGNRNNNTPKNLTVMDRIEHVRYHLIQYNKSEAHRKIASVTNKRDRHLKAKYISEYNRSQKHKDDNRKFWSDHERSHESRKKRSERFKETWQNPKARKNIISSIRASNSRRNATPEGQIQMRKNLARAWYVKCSCGRILVRNITLYPDKVQGITCSCGLHHQWNYILGTHAFELNQTISPVLNHKVVSIEPAGEEDVYDFTVKDYHNFALSDCVIVSNSIDEDIFWPISKNSQSKIEKLPGSSNIGDIADVQMYINLFFAGLRIPKAFMGFEGEIMAREVLPYQSIRYANVAYKLQRAVLTSLVRLYQIHLTLLGYDMSQSENSFKVHTSTISHLYDVAKAELLQAKMEIMKTLLDFGDQVQLDKNNWLRYILRTYLDMEDSVIQTLFPAQTRDEIQDIPSEDRDVIERAIATLKQPETMNHLKNLTKMAPYFNPSASSENTEDDYSALTGIDIEEKNDEFHGKIRDLIEKRILRRKEGKEEYDYRTDTNQDTASRVR